MFNIFGSKKNVQIHESIELQRHEVLSSYDSQFAQEILDGEDCDQIANGFGPIGSRSNPLPVNGPIGSIKYLGKLRTLGQKHVFFHRIGSFESAGTVQSIDVYEVVSVDGIQWANICLDMYHPRRSNLAPQGFQLEPLPKNRDFDLPFGFGSNQLVKNFPYGLPEVLEKQYAGTGVDGVGEKVTQMLALASFTRPTK